jgi:hypothetical protein
MIQLGEPRPMRVSRNSSSRPNPVKRGASRDPEVKEMMTFLRIPDLAMLLSRLSGMTVFIHCDTPSVGVVNELWRPERGM